MYNCYQNAEDKFIIKKQNDEIEELKRLVEARKRTPSLPAADNNRLLQLQAEVERELLEKRHLQHRLHVISSEKEVKIVKENFGKTVEF